MDPSRSSHKRPRRDTPSRRATPLNPEDNSHPLRASTSHHTQPSLPSIRQLHPYLPPSGMSQHIPGSTEGSGYGYPPSQSGYPVASSSNIHLGQHDQTSLSMPAQVPQPEHSGRGESEHEGEDQHGPPKKKRRRQALSCTG